MPRSDINHRIRKNPWPWLVGILLLTLTFMWVREIHVVRQTWLNSKPGRPISERIASLPTNPHGPSHLGFMMLVGHPHVVDPFGNFYYYNSWKVPGGHFRQLLIITCNLDGTQARWLDLRAGGGSHYEGLAPKTDFIVPSIFSALFFTFSILWIRNGRQTDVPAT